jgi:hypothetical protein
MASTNITHTDLFIVLISTLRLEHIFQSEL